MPRQAGPFAGMEGRTSRCYDCTADQWPDQIQPETRSIFPKPTPAHHTPPHPNGCGQPNASPHPRYPPYTPPTHPREIYELQRELGHERAASEALSAERNSVAGRAGESERLLQGLVGAQAEGLKAQGVLESQVGIGHGMYSGTGCLGRRGGASGRRHLTGPGHIVG